MQNGHILLKIYLKVCSNLKYNGYIQLNDKTPYGIKFVSYDSKSPFFSENAERQLLPTSKY